MYIHVGRLEYTVHTRTHTHTHTHAHTHLTSTCPSPLAFYFHINTAQLTVRQAAAPAKATQTQLTCSRATYSTKMNCLGQLWYLASTSSTFLSIWLSYQLSITSSRTSKSSTNPIYLLGVLTWHVLSMHSNTGSMALLKHKFVTSPALVLYWIYITKPKGRSACPKALVIARTVA